MAKNTVKLKNYSDVMEEYTATAVALVPGALVELTSNGVIQAHSVAGGDVVPPMFVVENEMMGGGIDTNIAASSKAQVWIPYRGDQVYALLKDGQIAAIGSKLESAGDGTLQVHTPAVDSSAAGNTEYTNPIVGVALEALDLSGSANTAAGRIKVRIN